MSEFALTAENYKAYFSWDIFKDLNEADREELIRFSIEQIRGEKGLKDVRVEFYSGEATSRGACYQDFKGKKCIGHTIRLNNDILSEKKDYYSPYKTFNTINHELEHASQYEHASDKKIKNSDSATLEQRLNDQHYYCSDGDKRYGFGERTYRFDKNKDYQMYRAQACEAEARAAGYSAVESLKTEGQSDAYLESYLKTQKAREINNNRQMLQQLGMHSREEMAREELNYLSDKKVSEEDRQRVLEYARQKDFETAKEVLLADSRGELPEEELKKRFDNNNNYSNFYKSEEYNSKKVKDYEHKNYSYANYKWNDNGEIEDEIEFNEMDVSQEARESRTAPSLFQRIKGATAGMIVSAHMRSAMSAHDNGYKTTAGYYSSLLGKGAVRLIYNTGKEISGGPLTLESSSALDSVEILGHAYDEYWAIKHPNKVIDFSPKQVSQELVDKNTLIVTDPRDPYRSSIPKNEMGDENFFIHAEREFSNVDSKEDREFFAKQETLQEGGETIQEDKSFFEKIEQGINNFGEKMDAKLENAAEKIAETTQRIKGSKQ